MAAWVRDMPVAAVARSRADSRGSRSFAWRAGALTIAPGNRQVDVIMVLERTFSAGLVIVVARMSSQPQLAIAVSLQENDVASKGPLQDAGVESGICASG